MAASLRLPCLLTQNSRRAAASRQPAAVASLPLREGVCCARRACARVCVSLTAARGSKGKSHASRGKTPRPASCALGRALAGRHALDSRRVFPGALRCAAGLGLLACIAASSRLAHACAPRRTCALANEASVGAPVFPTTLAMEHRRHAFAVVSLLAVPCSLLADFLASPRQLLPLALGLGVPILSRAGEIQPAAHYDRHLGADLNARWSSAN